jgi:DNA uptake protein ComE-like DNA-binding protein
MKRKTKARKSKTRNSYALFIGGIAAGTALLWLWRQLGRPGRELHITTNDLNYPDVSPEKLSREHLIDLNTADRDQLETLGLSSDALERLIENRPYRGRLELLSRMILGEGDFETIKHKIGVSGGREPVKSAVQPDHSAAADPATKLGFAS